MRALKVNQSSDVVDHTAEQWVETSYSSQCSRGWFSVAPSPQANPLHIFIYFTLTHNSGFLSSSRSRTLRGSAAAVEHLRCRAASCLVTPSPPACRLTLMVLEASLTSWACPVQEAATWDRHTWAAFSGVPVWAAESMATILTSIQTASLPA